MIEIRWILALLHLLALGIGLGAVWMRSRALAAVGRAGAPLQPAFYADNFWGLAAVLWLITGLLRAFGNYEKGSTYYLGNALFIAKMFCFVLLFLLEIRPMITLIRWRLQSRRGQTPDTGPASAFARIGYLQAALLVLMVILATGMARGVGFIG